jgi:hypothetical protein
MQQLTKTARSNAHGFGRGVVAHARWIALVEVGRIGAVVSAASKCPILTMCRTWDILVGVPHDVPLPDQIRQLWKVKVLDREDPRETPHVTIFRRTRKWRVGIRDSEFLDDDPPPRDVPREILAAIQADLAAITAYWNRVHPSNPV